MLVLAPWHGEWPGRRCTSRRSPLPRGSMHARLVWRLRRMKMGNFPPGDRGAPGGTPSSSAGTLRCWVGKVARQAVNPALAPNPKGGGGAQQHRRGTSTGAQLPRVDVAHSIHSIQAQSRGEGGHLHCTHGGRHGARRDNDFSTGAKERELPAELDVHCTHSPRQQCAP
jgi:hypothetical protein